MNTKNKVINEKTAKGLIWVGLVVFIIGLTIFVFKEQIFNLNGIVNSEKIGQFGDLIGGVVGSIWALAGVLLFYIALQEQRRDIKINRDALRAQIEEFKQQKEELRLSREVYQDQNETIKIQRFESTFFNLIELHQSTVNTLYFNISGTPYTKYDCLTYIYDIIQIKYKGNFDRQNVKSNVSKLMDCYEGEPKILISKHLQHYFRTVENIVDFITTASPANIMFYISLLKSLMSKYELVLLFVFIVCENEIELQALIEKYGLFENIDLSIGFIMGIRDYFDESSLGRNADVFL